MPNEEMSVTCTQSGREDQLQFLRFLAFLNIYITHAEVWIFFKYPTSHCGTAAVSFFFMLSGLVTGFSSCGKDIRLSLREHSRYMWRKIKKVYPLYFFTTIYTFLYLGLQDLTALVNLSDIPKQLFRNLFLIQSWFPEGYFSYNGVGWFLSTLLFLSAFNYPLMYFLNKINRHPKDWLLLLGGLAAVLFSTSVYCYLTKTLDMNFWQYIFPPARMGEYVSGMILGVLIHSWKPYLKPGRAVRVLFTVLEIAALCYWFRMLSHSGGSWRSRIFTWLMPNIFLLSVFTCGRGWISALFQRKLLVALGDVSFECFLIHNVFIVQYVIYYGGREFSPLENTVTFLYCLGLTVLLAFLIHKWLEKKRVENG